MKSIYLGVEKSIKDLQSIKVFLKTLMTKMKN